MSKTTLQPGALYEFKQLEEYLNDYDQVAPGTFLLVENVGLKERAIMHVFMESLCGTWKSGNAILFYSDGEACSANDSDSFLFISMHHPDLNLVNYE
jgi:hypothetical protein